MKKIISFMFLFFIILTLLISCSVDDTPKENANNSQFYNPEAEAPNTFISDPKFLGYLEAKILSAFQPGGSRHTPQNRNFSYLKDVTPSPSQIKFHVYDF